MEQSGQLHRSGRLPDFLIIGAAKCGTTALSEYLRAHPEIFVGSQKEIQFFSRDYHRGVDWYAAHFDSAESFQVAGEASPQYTQFPLVGGVAQRVYDKVPRARLIYLVREPLARIVSHYAMIRGMGHETRSIDEAIRADHSLIDMTRYRTQVDQYLQFFPREQILVLDADALLRRRLQTFAQVCTFLGVDPEFQPEVLEKEVAVGGVTRTQPGRWFSLSQPILHSTRVSQLIPLGVKLRAVRWRRRHIAVSQLSPSDDTVRLVRSQLADEMRGIAELMDSAPDWARS